MQLELDGLVISSLLFLFSQMQKEDSIDSLLRSLMIDLTKLLCKPRAGKQHITDLAQKPLAPNSAAKRCMLQPLDLMVVFSGRYLLNFLACYFSMYSSHGQVNSVRIGGIRKYDYNRVQLSRGNKGRKRILVLWIYQQFPI